mgnify:CR=1 FL=1
MDNIEKKTPVQRQRTQGRKTPSPVPENPCGWNSSTVVHILERREYTGCVGTETV